MDAMDRSRITIRSLAAHSPELRITALWRHEAFLKADGFSLADSEAQLTKLATTPEGPETALIAFVGGRLAGICLLVLNELEPAHDDLSPWLASLYVDPQFRGQGVARRLISAIEEHARGQASRGFTCTRPMRRTFIANAAGPSPNNLQPSMAQCF